MLAKEKKKIEIAKAAKELFTDFGYKSVSMDQIAARANVAKGTLYLYFKDKEDLFYYLAQQFLNDIADFIHSVEGKRLSILDEVHEVIYNLLKYRRDQKFLYKVMQDAKNFKTPAALYVEKMLDDAISSYLEKRTQQAIDQGVIKPCNATILSFIVIKVYTALAFEWEENHEPLDEKSIAENVGLFLRDGLIANR